MSFTVDRSDQSEQILDELGCRSMEAICFAHVRQRVCYIQRRVCVVNKNPIAYEMEAAGNQQW
jgi:hypothetical protein